MPRYRVDLHRKRQKEQREKQVMSNRTIDEINEELDQLDSTIKEKQKLLRAKQAQLKRIDSKV